jgi:hypothetical protein
VQNRPMPQIVADRDLGQRRSARSKEGRTRYVKAAFGCERQCDAFESERHHQQRRLCGKRRRGKEDRGADRAIIVTVTGILSGIMGPRFLLRLGKRNRMRFRDCADSSSPYRIDMHIADMNVPERQHDLQHKRCKPEPRTIAPMEPHPPHGRHANVTMLHLARGTTRPAHLGTSRMWRRPSTAPPVVRSDARHSPSRRSGRPRRVPSTHHSPENTRRTGCRS